MNQEHRRVAVTGDEQRAIRGQVDVSVAGSNGGVVKHPVIVLAPSDGFPVHDGSLGWQPGCLILAAGQFSK